MKIHVEIYLASRLLEREQGMFSAGDLIERVDTEFGDNRLGVETHASSHCVANAAPNAPTVYNYLWRIERNCYRCFDPTRDRPHPRREDARTRPYKEDVPAEYQWLLP